VNPESVQPPLWPFLVFLALAVFLVAFMLVLSAVTGHRRSEATGEPYESGIVSTGSAKIRFHAGYYLMAMFFVVFDMEAAFVYAYAVAFRTLGWSGYVEILVFIFVLGAALFYLWRDGALDWGPTRVRRGGKGLTRGYREAPGFPNKLPGGS
jgi:NADH-quinone oxidoreductase subunit A